LKTHSSSPRAAMIKLVWFGRLCFAVSLIGFGILQFSCGDFVPGRAPSWPASIPGRLIWAYASGLVLIASGTAIISQRQARRAALLSAALIFGWALLRHIPVVAAHRFLDGSWTNLGKAVVCVGGLCAVAGSLPETSGLVSWRTGFTYLGRISLGYFMIQSGIQHFMFTQFVATLVPGWIPGPRFWTYFAGVALIAGGTGLIFPPTARLAAGMSGLMIFLWLVMLHIPRALNAEGQAQRRNEWTAVFEALAFSGLAFVLTGSLAQRVERFEDRS
jgi:uncharacterized membrane protein